MEESAWQQLHWGPSRPLLNLEGRRRTTGRSPPKERHYRFHCVHKISLQRYNGRTVHRNLCQNDQCVSKCLSAYLKPWDKKRRVTRTYPPALTISPPSNISEIRTHLTIQFNQQCYWFTRYCNQCNEILSTRTEHLKHCPRHPGITVLDRIYIKDLNIHQGSQNQHFSLGSRELKNNSSRNELLSILVPTAGPETTGLSWSGVKEVNIGMWHSQCRGPSYESLIGELDLTCCN